VSVGSGGDQVQRDAVPVGGHRALHALFAPVHRRAAGDLTTTRGLGDASVHGQLVEVQSDDLVVGGQADPQQRGPVPGLGPLAQAAADGPVRASRRGDPLVAAAVHERADQVVEHDPIGDAAAVTAPRVDGHELGALVGPDQGSQLDPQRLDERCWQQRHGLSW
jgi:hypothetical protein